MAKVAILGAGYACQFYINALLELGHPIVGIASRTGERGKNTAAKACAKYFDNVEELYQNSGADILCITTPTSNHFDAISKVPQSDIKWVFCEKPLAMNLVEASRIQKICLDHKIKLGVGFKMRFESIFKKVKEIISQGDIGSLILISMNFYQTIPHSRWFLDSGFIRETLSHLIDLANWFTNAIPTRVLCVGESCLGGAEEDRAYTMIEYACGIRANINGGWIKDYPTSPSRQNICFEVVGTKGYICGVRPDKLLVCNESERKTIDINVIDPIKTEFTDFVNHVSKGKTPSVSVSEAINAQLVIDAARKSYKSACAVNIESDK